MEDRRGVEDSIAVAEMLGVPVVAFDLSDGEVHTATVLRRDDDVIIDLELPT